MKKILVIFGFSLLGSSAMADGGSGFGQVFNMFFGTESAREKNATCDGGGANEGMMGVVNGFFCHMEKDMGITGVTSGVTKQFGSMSVRAVVESGSYTVASVSYDYKAQVWVCSTGCTVASGFNRAIIIFFSYAADKSVNKGHLVMNPQVFDDPASTSAINLQYDVGTGTATKSIIAKAKFTEGTNTFRMRMDGSKSSNTFGATGVMTDGTNSFRFASQLDVAANTGGVYFEGTGASGSGTGTYSGTAASDDKSASSMCFTRARSDTDWTYTATGTSGCTVKAFPSDSGDTVGGWTQANILTISTEWEGMSANPSGI